ncbi:RAMP superfamily CRISPR-associated protein [Megasphaera sp.]|uniref:type III-A CRISPR-associated RAMP protein Csm4 n=1 Tax=Megasphaera sp. TaxID=2023260 RepID=UPI0025C2A465|nr:RAMP superfamily CRISPR-associated protein [Megasphaera sp.]MCF0153876.1 CRISPR-associated protein Csm4 [Megasphaera sp.]
MKYALYPLQFDTPVHFGCAEKGGKLEQSSLIYRADSLFGALCYELSLQGNKSGLDHLQEAVVKGKLLFSDLFPYISDEAEGLQLYVPKPILTVPTATRKKPVSYDSFRKQATQQKRQKKLSYIRVSQFADFVQAMKSGHAFSGDEPAFGCAQLLTRVNCTGDVPRPYYVHQIQFAKNAGLYGLIGYEDEEDLGWLLSLLESLGLSGIGGKRSSGYGKFHFREDPVEMDELGIYEDDGILYKGLTQTGTSMYMCLSVLLPSPAEVADVQEGQYTLCRRSGFLSPDGSRMQKKNDIYMIQAGSCFPKKIAGCMADVGGQDMTHPVWRYGKGLYMGLML